MSGSSAASATASLDQDAEQLRALGYSSNFNRSMSLWENFSLGFTYLSPVVGVYTLFGLCLAAGGPPMFWSYLLIGLGQMLVCLVFGEVVSSVPYLWWCLPLGAPPGRQALGLDGGLGLCLGVVRHHCRCRRRCGPLHGGHARF